VSHPFRIFQRNGWETTKPMQADSKLLAPPQVAVPEGQAENSHG
jgi:hypothetical protein